MGGSSSKNSRKRTGTSGKKTSRKVNRNASGVSGNTTSRVPGGRYTVTHNPDAQWSSSRNAWVDGSGRLTTEKILIDQRKYNRLRLLGLDAINSMRRSRVE